MSNLIQFEIIHNHIGLITLNRPEAANAMSKQLLNDLNKTITLVNDHPNIYCTILTGASDKAFCAGADLKERKGMSNEEVIETVKLIGNTVTNIEQMNMPTIAVLNGVAFGGGLELALACDLRIARDDTQMGLTETSLAIIPGAGGTQRLPRLIGLGKAKELIFTGRRLPSTEALTIGLVERLVAKNQLMEESIKIAKMISQNGPIALKQAKIAINKGIEVDLSTGLAIEHLCYKETIPTEDRLEGLQAFQEKRKPVYKGK